MNEWRHHVPPPYQSHFRVLALLVYVDKEGKTQYITGTKARREGDR